MWVGQMTQEEMISRGEPVDSIPVYPAPRVASVPACAVCGRAGFLGFGDKTERYCQEHMPELPEEFRAELRRALSQGAR